MCKSTEARRVHCGVAWMAKKARMAWRLAWILSVSFATATKNWCVQIVICMKEHVGNKNKPVTTAKAVRWFITGWSCSLSSIANTGLKRILFFPRLQVDKISSSDSECTDICEPACFFFWSLRLIHWYYSAPTTPCVRNRVIQAPDSIYPKLTSMFVTAVAIKSITVKSQSKSFKHIKWWFKFEHETNRKDLPPRCFTKWQLFTELRASKKLRVCMKTGCWQKCSCRLTTAVAFDCRHNFCRMQECF